MQRLPGIHFCLLGLLLIEARVQAAELKIGLLARPDEPFYESLCRGASLAVSNFNASAQTSARLIVRGRPGQWGTDGDEAVVLVFDEGVDAIITSTDGALTHQALQVAGRTHVPVVSLCADSSITGTGVPWAVQLVPSTRDEARCIFAGAPGIKQWTMVIPTERPGREIARDLSTAARVSRVTVNQVISLSAASDLTSAARRIVTAQSDGVLLWLDPAQAGRLIDALRTAGYVGQLAGPTRLHSSISTRFTGTSAERFICAYPQETRGDSADGRAFRTAFVRAYAIEPDFVAIMAYEAAQLLLKQFTTPDRPALNRVRDAQGVFGPILFDHTGDRVLPLTIVSGGEVEFH